MSSASTGSAETPTFDPIPVDAPAPPTKIGLVGFTKSREDAPYDDPSWTLAGCNNLWRQPGMDGLWQKCGAWYDLHSAAEIDCDPPHVEWLKQGPIPCFVMPTVLRPEWPSALAFPYQEVIDWARGHGVTGADYFTNSVSWMIAHAHMGLERNHLDLGRGGEIGLWGIDMAVAHEEYGQQRPSCEFWLGFAEGRGIKVTISERSDLLKTAGLYGVAEMGALGAKLDDRAKELQEGIDACNAEINNLQNRIQELSAKGNQYLGALENCRYIRGVWTLPEGKRGGGDDPYSTEASEPASTGA